MSKRRNHHPEFKVKVALEAIKGELTLSELAQKYELHPNQIITWKKALLENATGIFEGKVKSSKNREAKEKEELYKQIGQMKVELDFLKRKSGL